MTYMTDLYINLVYNALRECEIIRLLQTHTGSVLASLGLCKYRDVPQWKVNWEGKRTNKLRVPSNSPTYY